MHSLDGNNFLARALSEDRINNVALVQCTSGTRVDDTTQTDLRLEVVEHKETGQRFL